MQSVRRALATPRLDGRRLQPAPAFPPCCLRSQHTAAMTSLLKRLSITKARLDDAGVPSSASGRLTSSTSFSDFSMGAHQDGRRPGGAAGAALPGCVASLPSDAAYCAH